MDISIRTATLADFPAIAELDSASFGVHYEDIDLTDFLGVLDMDRFLVAVDDEQIVGVAGDYPFTMTVPGGHLEVPGVTWVSVDVTRRRRGVLTQLMDTQLSGYRRAGAPAAILTASEGAIYGRFGYGAASQVRRTVVPRRRLTLRREGDAAAVRRASPDQARERMPAIHDRWREQTPGALERTSQWWDYLCLDRPIQRGGMSGLFYLVHEDGYVAYRVKDQVVDGEARRVCWLADYVIASARAHADLWSALLALDLFDTIESHRIPIDDPLQHVVADARLIRTELVADGVWMRPLDVAAMLGSRTYAIDIDTVVEVLDRRFGDGRFALSGGPDGATCVPTRASAALALEATHLGSVYLGGVRLEGLARAGRLDVADPSALTRLDRALQADRLPVHGTNF